MISGNEKGGGKVDIASLIVLGKAVLEEKTDPCKGLTGKALFNCRIEHGK